MKITNVSLISEYHVLILIMMLLVVLITNVKCTRFFSDLYNTVVNSCIIASDMCLPKTGVKKGSSKVGMNMYRLNTILPCSGMIYGCNVVGHIMVK